MKTDGQRREVIKPGTSPGRFFTPQAKFADTPTIARSFAVLTVIRNSWKAGAAQPVDATPPDINLSFKTGIHVAGETMEAFCRPAGRYVEALESWGIPRKTLGFQTPTDKLAADVASTP